MNETALDGRFNNLTDLTERKRSKKKEDTTTTEYYLKFSFFGLDKWEYLTVACYGVGFRTHEGNSVMFNSLKDYL